MQPLAAPTPNHTHASPRFLSRATPQQPQTASSSPVVQLRHHVSLFLNVAAACPVFGRRTARAHYLQPPAQLAFKLPPHLLELAFSLQPWCHGRQRLQLLISCCPLSTVAFRLARVTGRHESHRAVEQKIIARILMRCISISALQDWAVGAVRTLAHSQRRVSLRCAIL